MVFSIRFSWSVSHLSNPPPITTFDPETETIPAQYIQSMCLIKVTVTFILLPETSLFNFFHFTPPPTIISPTRLALQPKPLGWNHPANHTSRRVLTRPDSSPDFAAAFFLFFIFASVFSAPVLATSAAETVEFHEQPDRGGGEREGGRTH